MVRPSNRARRRSARRRGRDAALSGHYEDDEAWLPPALHAARDAAGRRSMVRRTHWTPDEGAARVIDQPRAPAGLAPAAGTNGSVVVDRCQVCGSAELESVLFLGYLPPVNQ